jgi:ABC-type sugar transport system ATPase subunit
MTHANRHYTALLSSGDEENAALGRRVFRRAKKEKFHSPKPAKLRARSRKQRKHIEERLGVGAMGVIDTENFIFLLASTGALFLAAISYLE